MAGDEKPTKRVKDHESSSSLNPTPSEFQPALGPLQPTHRTQFASISFATVIEADHATLSALALSVISSTHSASVRAYLLTTLVWRLIRHDLSEELVMRPAFARYMGDEGVRLAEHDRRDHYEIKRKLVGLVSRIQTGAEDMDQWWLVNELKPLSCEMAEHMREESGMVIPRFVGLVSDEVTLELGRRYIETLALTPELVARHSDMERVRSEGEAELQLSDVMNYANLDVDVFRGMLERLKNRAAEGVDGGYLEGQLREELKRMGLSTYLDSRQSDTVQSDKTKGKL